jgi:hypothetical protein
MLGEMIEKSWESSSYRFLDKNIYDKGTITILSGYSSQLNQKHSHFYWLLPDSRQTNLTRASYLEFSEKG